MGQNVSNPTMSQDRLVNSGVHSDTLEQLNVPPKEMIRVFGLQPNWYIKQGPRSMFDCSPEQTYRIGATIDGSGDMYTALEKSSSLLRCCCSSGRSWTTEVSYGGLPGGETVLQLQHPCRLPTLPLKCCCHQTVLVTDVQNEEPLGSVSETCWLCVPNYVVRDAKGQDAFDIHPPTCLGGCCVNCCASPSALCCCRVPFEVYYADGVRPVGSVSKLWKNICAEVATEDATFRFVGPEVVQIVDPGKLNLADLDKKIGNVATRVARDAKQALGITTVNNVRYNLEKIHPKAWQQSSQLLAATLLINQVHFES